MVQKVGIPDQYRAGIVSVVLLSEPSFKELFGVIQRVGPCSGPDQLSRAVISAFSLESAEDTNDIVQALVSLQWARNYFGLSTSEFADQIVATLVADEEVKLDAKAGQNACQRLASLLELDTLSIAGRSVEIFGEYSNKFCGARIVTDIRTVFRSEREADPIAAGIIHGLRISYHHGNRLEEFYVALDPEDILSLKDVLARAVVKEASLDVLLEKAGLPRVQQGS